MVTKKQFLISAVFSFLVFVDLATADDAIGGRYGSPFSYEVAKSITFPDFSFRYDGTEPGANYPGTNRRMGDVIQFRVETAEKSQAVSWSSGTGDIGPSFFKVGMACFRLELKQSDKIGRLEAGNAVISRETEMTNCQ